MDYILKFTRFVKLNEEFKSVSTHGDRALLAQSFRVDLDRGLFPNQGLNMSYKSNRRYVPNEMLYLIY